MTTKLAADLQRRDAVIIAPGDRRVVEDLELTENPIDTQGTTGVRVHWFGRAHWSTIAADKPLTIEDPA